MIEMNKDLQIPVVITHTDKYCDVFVPDLNITVHGRDYVDAIANAIYNASAIYYYSLERDLQITLDTTYEEAMEKRKSKQDFVMYVCLTN